MSREKAREYRKAFRQKFLGLAERYHESQSDRYPVDYRQREGDAILREMNAAEAELSSVMLRWNWAQQNEVSRLRASDPVGDPATETRRLREQMEVANLAERYPSQVQGKNILLPEARRLLNAGNLDRAQVYLAAAKKVGADDGRVEHEINGMLDATIPHRRQAAEIEVAAVDELELARRDVAQMRVVHKVGTVQELARASTAVKMADFKREREAGYLKQETGIELPVSTD